MSACCYINEFRPLAETFHRRKAIVQHNLPPFIDASCRREPDLESIFPSITALCRAGHFAPRLKPGDVIAYMTVDFVYPPGAGSARRLVAVLRVKKSWRSREQASGCEAHEQAATWYREQGLPLPSNCLVLGNRPVQLDKTDRYQSNLRLWDSHYRRIAHEHGVFHACEKAFCDLSDPPQLTNRQLVEWFATIPDMRQMPPLPPRDFANLLRWLGEKTKVAGSRESLNVMDVGHHLVNGDFSETDRTIL